MDDCALNEDNKVGNYHWLTIQIETNVYIIVHTINIRLVNLVDVQVIQLWLNKLNPVFFR